MIVVRTTSSQPVDSEIIVSELENRGAKDVISERTGAEVTKIASQPQVENGVTPDSELPWKYLLGYCVLTNSESQCH